MMVSGESYRFIERVCVALVVAFTATTLVSVVSLQWTEYAVTGGDLVDGLRFKLPADLMIAMGAFGLTGVGGDEIMQYTYWLIEKGYAAKNRSARSPATRPGSAAPAAGSTSCTSTRSSRWSSTPSSRQRFICWEPRCFMPAAKTPEGYATINTLALHVHRVARRLGPQRVHDRAPSSCSSRPSSPRWRRGRGVFTDAAGKLGMIDFQNVAQRRRAITLLAWFFPLAWATIFLVYKEPVYHGDARRHGDGGDSAGDRLRRRQLSLSREGPGTAARPILRLGAWSQHRRDRGGRGLRRSRRRPQMAKSESLRRLLRQRKRSISAKTQADDVKSQAE